MQQKMVETSRNFLSGMHFGSRDAALHGVIPPEAAAAAAEAPAAAAAAAPAPACAERHRRE